MELESELELEVELQWIKFIKSTFQIPIKINQSFGVRGLELELALQSFTI